MDFWRTSQKSLVFGTLIPRFPSGGPPKSLALEMMLGKVYFIKKTVGNLHFIFVFHKFVKITSLG